MTAINCATATYGKNSLKVFGANCVPGWRDFFKRQEVKDALDIIDSHLSYELNAGHLIEPRMPLVFKALERVAPAKIKVVILGQDPTPQPGEATGLAFSVQDARTVPSVLNVLLEVALEGWSVNIFNGDLTKWANQGVLLLNKALTVRRGTPGTHLTKWSKFMKLLIKEISGKAQPSVWLLWGTKVQIYQKIIKEKGKHYLITGGHPSPVGGIGTANTFFGGNYFQCANTFLRKKVRDEIDWGLAVLNRPKREARSPLNPCPPEPILPISAKSKAIKKKGGYKKKKKGGYKIKKGGY